MDIERDSINDLTERAEQLIKSAPALIKMQPLFKEAEDLLCDLVERVTSQDEIISQLEMQLRAYEFAEGADYE